MTNIDWTKPVEAVYPSGEADKQREVDAWIETGAQAQRNSDYYSGLIDAVAPMLGTAMYTQDDGGVVTEPLRACLPKAVAALRRQVEADTIKRCAGILWAAPSATAAAAALDALLEKDLD